MGFWENMSPIRLTFYLKKKLYCLFSLIVNQIHVHWRKAGSAKENNKIIKPPPIPQSPLVPGHCCFLSISLLPKFL